MDKQLRLLFILLLSLPCYGQILAPILAGLPSSGGGTVTVTACGSAAVSSTSTAIALTCSVGTSDMLVLTLAGDGTSASVAWSACTDDSTGGPNTYSTTDQHSNYAFNDVAAIGSSAIAHAMNNTNTVTCTTSNPDPGLVGRRYFFNVYKVTNLTSRVVGCPGGNDDNAPVTLSTGSTTGAGVAFSSFGSRFGAITNNGGGFTDLNSGTSGTISYLTQYRLTANSTSYSPSASGSTAIGGATICYE